MWAGPSQPSSAFEVAPVVATDFLVACGSPHNSDHLGRAARMILAVVSFADALRSPLSSSVSQPEFAM
jgi:hypothetical protein